MFNFNNICSKFIEESTKRSIIQTLASMYDSLSLLMYCSSYCQNEVVFFFQDICVYKFT